MRYSCPIKKFSGWSPIQNKKASLLIGKRGFYEMFSESLRLKNVLLADQGGFEPPEGLTPRTLSRRVT